ncbi:MAG: hypothetical protein JSS49_28185 [Planctomycetes bacterium]|nr:hypothetical protein [Planctomycetota bacterium]
MVLGVVLEQPIAMHSVGVNFTESEFVLVLPPQDFGFDRIFGPAGLIFDLLTDLPAEIQPTLAFGDVDVDFFHSSKHLFTGENSAAPKAARNHRGEQAKSFATSFDQPNVDQLSVSEAGPTALTSTNSISGPVGPSTSRGT